MRILLVHPGPDFSVADVYNGWFRALKQLGHDVKTFNTNDRLSFYSQIHLPDYKTEGQPLRKAFESEQAMTLAMQGLSHDLYTFWPDVVIMVSAFYTSSSTFRVIRARKHKVVLIHTESPYQDDEQLVRAQFADVNLLNDPSNLADYQALVPNSHYMPHAYDPQIHRPGKGEYKSDFAFVGTMFKSRKVFFEKMLSHLQSNDPAGYRITLGGAGWDNEYMNDSPLLQYLAHERGHCVDNPEVAKLYRISRAGINFYRREAEGEHMGEGWSMGPREVEMAACGIPFVRDPRPESDLVFGGILPTFSSPEEAAEELTWMLDHEETRQHWGEQIREAIKDRTFLNNAKQLMKYLEKA